MNARIRNLALAAYVVGAGHFTLQTGRATNGSASLNGCYSSYNACETALNLTCSPLCFIVCRDTSFTCMDPTPWLGECLNWMDQPC
jgi:hypothetical protein